MNVATYSQLHEILTRKNRNYIMPASHLPGFRVTLRDVVLRALNDENIVGIYIPMMVRYVTENEKADFNTPDGSLGGPIVMHRMSDSNPTGQENYDNAAVGFRVRGCINNYVASIQIPDVYLTINRNTVNNIFSVDMVSNGDVIVPLETTDQVINGERYTAFSQGMPTIDLMVRKDGSSSTLVLPYGNQTYEYFKIGTSNPLGLLDDDSKNSMFFRNIRIKNAISGDTHTMVDNNLPGISARMLWDYPRITLVRGSLTGGAFTYTAKVGGSQGLYRDEVQRLMDTYMMLKPAVSSPSVDQQAPYIYSFEQKYSAGNILYFGETNSVSIDATTQIAEMGGIDFYEVRKKAE